MGTVVGGWHRQGRGAELAWASMGARVSGVGQYECRGEWHGPVLVAGVSGMAVGAQDNRFDMV